LVLDITARYYILT